jgi:hypothetical protein
MTAHNAAGFAGLNLADELADFEPASPVAKTDPSSLRELSTRAGFPSREPQPPKAPPKPRPLNFDARMTVRVATEDKARFDELTYELRTSNGEVFRQALDALEEKLQRERGQGRAPTRR